MTTWAVKPADGDPFAPSKAPFMVNYRVDDLAALLNILRTEGCDVLDECDDSEFGKFGWVIDPEGNKVELWEPRRTVKSNVAAAEILPTTHCSANEEFASWDD